MTKMTTVPENYKNIRGEIVDLLDAAGRTVARNVNALMTVIFWEIGRRIVQSEQAMRYSCSECFSRSRVGALHGSLQEDCHEREAH
jgi:hypothetical protein